MGATIFVTGGTGFIGSAFVRRAVAGGHTVRVLARSKDSQEAARRLGAVPVGGDLSRAGDWQEGAARADWVVHLAQPRTFGGRVTRARAERYRDERLRMDRLLLDPLRADTVKRVLYVGGTSYYGNVGTQLVDEDTTPRPKGWGPYIAPAIEALARDLDRGLPLVVAFPGYVYGNGSWFREYVLSPLRARKKLTALGGKARTISPVHRSDCARALLHLLDRGETGRRYFVVDDQPSPSGDLSRIAAARMRVELRVRRVPPFLCRLLLGPVVTDSLLTDCVLSNARLRATGFTPEFPTIAEGVPDVVKEFTAAA
jgi:nucleoside-diphosphate-sugar epimerase